jgi:fructokinase
MASQPRVLVAVAGPPGAGKSTLSDALRTALIGQGHSAAVVPMDGFHLDNAVLSDHGLLARKGAPETFDVAGFIALVRRIAAREQVYYPVFDRTRDISIAGAAELSPETRFVIFEGNYLLCDVPVWRELHPLWSATISVDPGEEEISARLLARWLHHGLSEDDARARRDRNDLPNARFVQANSIAADLVLRG